MDRRVILIYGRQTSEIVIYSLGIFFLRDDTTHLQDWNQER